MKNNITLGYILNFLKFSWFFTGIWVFYYLHFTNYAGIGLIETVLIVTMTLTEIPSGALADLIGRKTTLILSFLLSLVCFFSMAFAQTYLALLISVFIGSIGGTFFSGTLEALIYDSLKAENREGDYDRVVSKNSSIQLLAIILSGLLSGLLYNSDPSMPYLASGFFCLIGFILSFFLVEPKIDSITFNFSNFNHQLKQGFKGLFLNTHLTFRTIILLIITGILVIADEMGESILAVDFGFRPENIGIFFSLAFLVASLVSQATPKINRYFSLNLIITLGIATALTFIASPFVGLFVGGITLILRQALATTLTNLTSIYINQNTKSQYRATTISTFNMIKNLPYAVSAYFIGSLVDQFSARHIYFYLGLILILALVLFSFQRNRKLDPAIAKT